MPKPLWTDREITVVFTAPDIFGKLILVTTEKNVRIGHGGWVTITYNLTDGTVTEVSYPPTAFSYMSMMNVFGDGKRA